MKIYRSKVDGASDKALAGRSKRARAYYKKNREAIRARKVAKRLRVREEMAARYAVKK